MLRSTILAHMQEALTESKFRFKQLQEIENEIPWNQLVKLIQPHYQSSSMEKNLLSIETMVRIIFLQVRYGMSPSGVEEALFQIEVLRDFALINIDKDIIPSKTCIENFNDLINEGGLKNKLDELFEVKSLVDEAES